MKKKLLLFGGNGFIGRHIQKETSKRNDWDMICIDKEEMDLSEFGSEQRIRQIVSVDCPDAIVVLAATKRQIKDGPEIKNLNNAISSNIAKGLKEFKGQIVYFSSCAVYGEKNEQCRITEKSKPIPTSDYGYHKIYSEEIYKAYCSKESRLLIIRPPLIYSCDELSGYSPGGFLNSALRDKEIVLWGDGREIRELIHVEDVACITMRLIGAEASGTINLVSGASYSYREIAEYIKKKLDIKIKCRARTGEKVNHTYNSRVLREVLAEYEFRTPFDAIDSKLNSILK